MTRLALGATVRWLVPITVLFALFDPVPPAWASSPVSVIISNVRDTAFVVSWLTSGAEPGRVQIVDGGIFQDDRGPDFSGSTHYVTVSGLDANTAYQFDILSGSDRYDNGGSHYRVMTGTSLAPPTPDLIVGRIRNPDGSNATDTIVLFTLQQEQSISAPQSMLLGPRDSGFFHISLSDARPQRDPTRYFPYGSQIDLLTIQAVGAGGVGSVRVPVSDARLRSTDPSQTLIVELNTGDQTPAFVERHATPTPIPAAPPQETGGLVVGVGVAALVIIGIILIAALLVWQR